MEGKLLWAGVVIVAIVVGVLAAVIVLDLVMSVATRLTLTP